MVASIPYLAQFIVTVACGIVVDIIRKTTRFSTAFGALQYSQWAFYATEMCTPVRKAVNSLSLLLASVFLVLTGYVSHTNVRHIWRAPQP